MNFLGFNTGIFGKNAPSRFVENYDEAKSVLNKHYYLFLLETFQVYLTMSLLYERVLEILPKIYTILTFYGHAN